MDQEQAINEPLQRETGKTGRMRFYSFLVLSALGLVLVIFGALRSKDVSHNTDDTDGAISGSRTTYSEYELSKLTTVGGLTRTETGEVKTTFKEGEKPASECPT